nr:penicillin-binding protein 2 [Kofleriaceae bacterium]
MTAPELTTSPGPPAPGVSRAAKIRACIAGAIVTVGICGVGYRAWALQVDDVDRYRAQAERQHEMRVAIPAPRGAILDARDRPLAVSADADSIWASPHDVRDVPATAEQLAKLLGGDAQSLEVKLASPHRFVWLARHVAPEVAAAVRAAKLPGVELAREPRRWYPARSLGGPVLGGADIDGRGIDGVEKSLDVLLAGKRGEAVALRDARGHAMLEDGLGAAEPGATVRLTIDRTIQSIADQALAQGVIAHQAKSGVAVVLDVATSRVLALASYPTLDPNLGPDPAARDRPVTDAYEAGSVMKVFSVAAALDDGVVTPDTGFDLGGGYFVVGKRPIHDVDHDPYLTVAGIVKRSSNVGAAKIALRLGRDKLYAALKRYGFGARTNIELPGEQTGMLRDGSKWRDIELATIAYGYGLTVTPIQVAAAMASIGNGGVYREPRVVMDVRDATGAVLYEPRPEPRQVMKPETAAEMRVILASVFDKGGKDYGTAHNIDVQGFACGGKTGTAHKWDPVEKKYGERYLGSFVGLAPIARPRIVVLVMVDDPAGSDYYGASVAGPVFAEIASQVLRYLGVPGDAPVVVPAGAVAAAASSSSSPATSPSQSTTTSTSTFVGMGLGKALEKARELKLDVVVHGSGRVTSEVIANGRVTLTLD